MGGGPARRLAGHSANIFLLQRRCDRDTLRRRELTLNTGGPAVATTQSFTKTGWFLGGGLETTLGLLGPGWFLRTEYRYASYNTSNQPETGVGGATVGIITFKPYVETLTTSIVYKFNWPQ